MSQVLLWLAPIFCYTGLQHLSILFHTSFCRLSHRFKFFLKHRNVLLVQFRLVKINYEYAIEFWALHRVWRPNLVIMDTELVSLAV